MSSPVDGYATWVRQVAAERPTGALVGAATGPNSIAKVSGWLRNQPGVPALSVYRLRSTWLCTLLVSDVAVTRVMAWAGLTKYNSLDGYRAYLRSEDVTARRDRPTRRRGGPYRRAGRGRLRAGSDAGGSG